MADGARRFTGSSCGLWGIDSSQCYHCASISWNTDNAHDDRGLSQHWTILVAARVIHCRMFLERFNPPMVGGIPPEQAGVEFRM
eukprot:4504892-Heterocapsa_arctica.AAC.1